MAKKDFYQELPDGHPDELSLDVRERAPKTSGPTSSPAQSDRTRVAHVKLLDDGSYRVGGVDVVEGPPTCHFCDTSNHPVVAAVLHTGSTVCAACFSLIKRQCDE